MITADSHNTNRFMHHLGRIPPVEAGAEADRVHQRVTANRVGPT